MAQAVNNWRVVDASFVTSAPSVAECPSPDRPEVAFAGRSNVGKSSLLNALVGQRGLARTSRTPGRTQLLNVFDVRLVAEGQPRSLRCVDLPGYGYVASGSKLRAGFGLMIEGYIAKRESLRAVILLVDARRGLGESDLNLLEFCTQHEVPSLLVMTKVDKLGASQRGLLRREVAESLGIQRRDVLLTSASAGIGITGSDGLVADLARLASEPPERAGA